jgi:serine/threonine protein kinase
VGGGIVWWLLVRRRRRSSASASAASSSGYELVPPPDRISQVISSDGGPDSATYDAAAPASTLARNSSTIEKMPSEATLARSSSAQVWRIAASELELGRVLGQGAFGVVSRAKWRGRHVAVKQIKRTAIGDEKAVADFELEIGRMSSLQPHENVVQLYGVVELANGDVGAVVEFCAQGALVDALYGDKARRDWTNDELLDVAYDAACGLMHLHLNNVVHRDIAARNVLLAGKKDLVAKVSDFGMARDMDGNVAEQQTAAHVGPLRWMAPEQIERLAYSKASDVFAFGVLLFEIFAREKPWAGVANVNVMAKVARGERMLPPKSHASRAICRLMEQCWAQNPSDRPTMQQVQSKLEREQEQSEG